MLKIYSTNWEFSLLEIIYSNSFKKDVKLMKKRGKDLEKLKAFITLLISGLGIPIYYRDHKLIGNYADRRECHLEPNWLVIYKKNSHQIILERTGTHSDLFK